jgi:hypothetical protein
MRYFDALVHYFGASAFRGVIPMPSRQAHGWCLCLWRAREYRIITGIGLSADCGAGV